MSKKMKSKDEPHQLTVINQSELNSAMEIDQFEIELMWCIQQLRASLNSGKLNKKQSEENMKLLNNLASNSIPVIKKRQLMRLTFGDYRKKMMEEEAKYKKIHSKVTIAPVQPNKKSLFVKQASSSAAAAAPTKVEDIIDKLTINNGNDNEQNTFHYKSTTNSFRFNFGQE